MSQPFPTYRTNRNSAATQCPLPNRIDSVNDYYSARYAASQCARAAEERARATNDPQWLQYTQFFDCFANEDRVRAIYMPAATDAAALQIGSPGGNAYAEYHGGAKLLLQASADSPQWLAARQALREQVTRYHLGLPAMQPNPLQPTIKCVRDPLRQCVSCTYTDF